MHMKFQFSLHLLFIYSLKGNQNRQ